MPHTAFTLLSTSQRSSNTSVCGARAQVCTTITNAHTHASMRPTPQVPARAWHFGETEPSGDSEPHSFWQLPSGIEAKLLAPRPRLLHLLLFPASQAPRRHREGTRSPDPAGNLDRCESGSLNDEAAFKFHLSNYNSLLSSLLSDKQPRARTRGIFLKRRHQASQSPSSQREDTGAPATGRPSAPMGVGPSPCGWDP